MKIVEEPPGSSMVAFRFHAIVYLGLDLVVIECPVFRGFPDFLRTGQLFIGRHFTSIRLHPSRPGACAKYDPEYYAQAKRENPVSASCRRGHCRTVHGRPYSFLEHLEPGDETRVQNVYVSQNPVMLE